MEVKIIADSTCDLPSNIIEQLDIDIVPLYVIMDDVSYKDGLEITPEKLIEWSDSEGKSPKTSAPSVEDFTKIFKPYADNNIDIVFIGIASELSATYQNACFAAELFEDAKIRVIDGRNVSVGTGYLVNKAAELSQSGMSTDEIADSIEELKLKVRSSFVFDSLEFLKRGGRCSAAKALAAGALKIRPRIDCIDGTLVPVQKYRGSIEKVVNRFCQSVLADLSNISSDICYVGGSLDEYGLIDIIYNKVKDIGYFKKIVRINAGCIITSHSGSNAYAIIYAEA